MWTKFGNKALAPPESLDTPARLRRYRPRRWWRRSAWLMTALASVLGLMWLLANLISVNLIVGQHVRASVVQGCIWIDYDPDAVRPPDIYAHKLPGPWPILYQNFGIGGGVFFDPTLPRFYFTAPGSPRSGWELDWPTSVPFFLCVLATWVVWRRTRVPEGLCPRCGYDLRGQTVNRCPECGLRYAWRYRWRCR